MTITKTLEVAVPELYFPRAYPLWCNYRPGCNTTLYGALVGAIPQPAGPVRVPSNKLKHTSNPGKIPGHAWQWNAPINRTKVNVYQAVVKYIVMLHSSPCCGSYDMCNGTPGQ